MACGYDAKVKIKTERGWSNLCIKHYDDYYLDQAQATCKRLGLDTVEQQREYVRNAVRKLVNKWTPVYQREPGEDLDEAA